MSLNRAKVSNAVWAGLLAIALIVPVLSVASSPAVAQSQGIWISEVHYHPQSVGDGTNSFDDREDTEFVEIAKFGGGSTDVSGWCFNRGIEFCFPAGTTLSQNETFVIARDAAAFADLYGFSPDGEYDGKLSNSGEVLRLTNEAGAIASSLEWLTSDPWPVTADGLGPSLELISNAGTNEDPANWEVSSSANGTPGSLPNVASGAPPLVVSRSYDEIATPGQPTQITAQATNTTAATLEYDINYGSNEQVPMQLLGGQWSAELPAVSEGTLVRFRIEVEGPNGSATSPRSSDSVDWWAVAAPSQPQSDVPVLDLYFSNWPSGSGAVAYEGRVWTDVMARPAGNSSLYAAKKNIRLDFPDGYPLVASFLDGTSDELTLDAGSTDTDMIREQLAWSLMERLGFAPIRTTHVRVERNGSFEGLYLLREEQDGSWRARNDLDRGLLYKSLPPAIATDPVGLNFGGAYEKKEGFDQSDDDARALSSCLRNWRSDESALRSCMLDTVDIPSVVNEMAAMLMINNVDQREFNFYLYRDDAENKLWRIEPDDLDRTLGIDVASRVSSPFTSPHYFYDRCDSGSSLANEMCRGLLNVPEFRTMFNRRVRTVIDEYLADPIVITEINQTADYIRNEWSDDEAKWRRNSASFEHIVSALENWVGDYVQYHRDGGRSDETPAAQSASPDIDIIELRPDAGDGLSFAILRNPSNSEAVDVSGWTLTGIEPIRPGTVVVPGQEVAIITNEPAFRAERPGFGGVRSWAEGSLASSATLRRPDGSIAATAGTPPTAPLILNEWNAVKSTNIIAGGDSALGSVAGNGGDWFELVVIEDDLDVRGWKLVLSDSDGGPLAIRDTFEFNDDPLLAQLQAGTIITVSESFVDDVAMNPARGDWHLNFQANSADDGAFFTGASQNNFDTNSNDWRLVIVDDAGTVMFGPAGEGIGTVTGITSEEIGELQVDPSANVDPAADYGDGDSSTFGAPNIADGQPQDFSELRFLWGDVNCDQVVNLLDALVVAQFSDGLLDGESQCPLTGSDSMYEPAGDYSLDGTIDAYDAELILRCVANIPDACS